MNFDIYQLDQVEPDESGETVALEAYQNDIIEAFSNSPEGKERLQTHAVGFWVANLISYGYEYIGTTLPQMTKGEIKEILTELFPEKVTLQDPENAGNVIPELSAFWQFLKREYQLPNADVMLEFLHSIEADYKNIMNDTSKFGTAKSFMTMGLSAGFDMTNQEDINKFIQIYNARLASSEGSLPLPLGGGMPDFESDTPAPSHSKKSKQKKKKLRKISKTSRMKNKKKRKG